MGNPIFISYRRDDSEGEAGRLFDDLVREFGSKNVFMDVTGIRPGVDFVKAIEANVADCGILLAIIGPTWATIAGADGVRRLDDPNDFVALEIASALKREVPVIPVLVHGARMPGQDQLPESLKAFSHRNSVELSHVRWLSDVQLLIEALRSYVVPIQATVPEPVHATVPVQLPAPHQPGRTAVARPEPKRSSLPWIAVIGAVIAAAVVIYLVTHRSSNQVTQQAPKSVTEQTPKPVTNQAPPAPSIVGTWKLPASPSAGQNSLTSLVISGSADSLTMQAFGSCEPAPCSWGNRPAVIDGQATTATFEFEDKVKSQDEHRVASVGVTPEGANVRVAVHNTFTDRGGGSHSSQATRVFVPGP
jgi:TIR domain